MKERQYKIMNIAILGAPGCVGRTIIKRFLDSSQQEIIASYRIEEEIPKDIQNDPLIWKQVDLFNPSSAENFLQGSDVLQKKIGTHPFFIRETATVRKPP